MSFLSAIFGGAKQPKAQSFVQPIQTVKTPTKDLAAEASQKDLDMRRQKAAAGGKNSTILTSGSSSEEEALISKKTLLGK